MGRSPGRQAGGQVGSPAGAAHPVGRKGSVGLREPGYSEHHRVREKTPSESSHSAATWMDLDAVIPSEVSQTEKDKYRMISLICGI